MGQGEVGVIDGQTAKASTAKALDQMARSKLEIRNSTFTEIEIHVL